VSPETRPAGHKVPDTIGFDLAGDRQFPTAVVGLAREEQIDLGVADGFLILERTDVGRHQRFDAVAESAGGFAEGESAAKPCRRSGVRAVVHPERRLADRDERTVP
jgi:hypothetical protein